jgi:hypothetical protein
MQTPANCKRGKARWPRERCQSVRSVRSDRSGRSPKWAAHARGASSLQDGSAGDTNHNILWFIVPMNRKNRGALGASPCNAAITNWIFLPRRLVTPSCRAEALRRRIHSATPSQIVEHRLSRCRHRVAAFAGHRSLVLAERGNGVQLNVRRHALNVLIVA